MILLAIYVVGAILSFGTTYAYFSRHYFSLNRGWMDYMVALTAASIGPVGLIVTYFVGEKFKYGFRLLPVKKSNIISLTPVQEWQLAADGFLGPYEFGPLMAEWLEETGVTAYCGLCCTNTGYVRVIGFDHAKDAVAFKLRFL